MKSIRISLNAGEKLYLNGAVIQTNRKTSLELLNEATFLLHQHIISADDAKTPCRQLYFIMQSMVMDPKNAPQLRPLLFKWLEALFATLTVEEAPTLLRTIRDFLDRDKLIDAMKSARLLFKIEDALEAATEHDPHPEKISMPDRD